MMVHIPVLIAEVLTGLAIQEKGIYIDATFGRGGHSRAILNKLSKQGQLIALDQDPEAVTAGRQIDDPRFTIVHARFSELQRIAQEQKVSGKIDGILLDIGVSSPQLDDAKRGFSFMHDGPLDMRMNPNQGKSAATLLAHIDEVGLADILYRYGEEHYSRRIAKAIVQARSENAILTTRQLAETITRAYPKWEAHKHPATRSFQALRIFINDELKELSDCLEQCKQLLKLGGRLAVISFHSLEDRLVKQFSQQVSANIKIPRHLPLTRQQLAGSAPSLRVVNKASRAGKAEVAINPRSRSATLRVMERIL